MVELGWGNWKEPGNNEEGTVDTRVILGICCRPVMVMEKEREYLACCQEDCKGREGSKELSGWAGLCKSGCHFHVETGVVHYASVPRGEPDGT